MSALLALLFLVGLFVIVPILLLKAVFGLLLFLVTLPFRILGFTFRVLGGVLGLVGSVLGAVLGVVLFVLALPVLLIALPLLVLAGMAKLAAAAVGAGTGLVFS